MIKRGLALSLVLGLASVAQAGAVLEFGVPPYGAGDTVTVDIFLKQDPVGSDVLIRLVELHMDDTDPALGLSNFQWAFGAVVHYKDADLAGGPAGVACAYYYEVPGDLGPNPGAQLTLPGNGSSVLIGTIDVTLPDPFDQPAYLNVLNADDADPDLVSLVAFGFDLGDDPVTAWRASDLSLSGGLYLFEPSTACTLVSSAPPHDGSLWRTANNCMELTCDAGCVLAEPGAGEVEIVELLAGGGYGADLSASFTFTVVGGNVLQIEENGTVLTNQTWYGVRNVGAWSGVDPFMIHVVVQAGDANGDGRVQFNDLSFINTGIPTDPAMCGDRKDINGDARVQFNDLSAANVSIPSDTIAKPAGH